jgi:hypothetical protein
MASDNYVLAQNSCYPRLSNSTSFGGHNFLALVAYFNVFSQLSFCRHILPEEIFIKQSICRYILSSIVSPKVLKTMISTSNNQFVVISNTNSSLAVSGKFSKR